jgi:general secretion pathway protein I
MTARTTARGFTLLEVLVATLIMGIAVSGILSSLANSTRSAARLTEYDRATLLAKSKMDELLVDHSLPRKLPMSGMFDPIQSGGTTAGWNATVYPLEQAPGAGAGKWVVDRVVLEIWWMGGSPSVPVRRSYTLEGFRRGILSNGGT